MARIRSIKPEFWEDEKLSDIPIQARLLFIGTWNFADDYGVLSDSVKWIKAKIFPYDSLRDNDVKQWCDALIKNRMLVPFNYGDKGYYIIRRFRSHQIIDKRYEKSILPIDVMTEILSKIEAQCPTSKTHSDHVVITSQDMDRKGEDMDRRGGEEKKSAKAEPPPPKNQKKVSLKIFRESEFFEKERLAAALFGTQYQDANVDYYHEVILNWSDSKQAKKADWLATAKNWMAKDMTEGKFISKSFKPPTHGSNKTIKQQATGAAVSTSSLLSKIVGMSD